MFKRLVGSVVTLGWLVLASTGWAQQKGESQNQPLLAPPVGPQLAGAPAQMVVPDEIVVELDVVAARMMDVAGTPARGTFGLPALDNVGPQLGVRKLRKLFPGADPLVAMQRGLPDVSGWYVVTFNPAQATSTQAAATYRAIPHIKQAQEIGIHPVSAVPNDGNYPSQWHLNQANDRDIDAPEAWNIETGDPSVIVAVLDTGVRYYHKDLGGSNASAANPTGADGNMWINAAEKNGAAGVDDDGNGYVDDWVGYDFVTGVTGCSAGEDCSTADNDPRDFNGHGTHCAGNVAAINNNGYATASPAGGWNTGTQTPTGNGVKVMALRIGYAAPGGGFVRMDFAASAFYYAANNGATIASCSWGSSNSGGVAAALDYFIASGSRLVFVAAGNANNQTAGYLNSRADCYSVAATDQNDVKASFSSYGTWVDISAPGVSILSSYHNSADPNNDYVANISGTSMACPLTAGTAAAVWSRQPAWTAGQVWDRVRTTVDSIAAQNPSYNGLLGSGRINLFNAVNTAPPPPQCQNNSECDDGNPCNGIETCVSGNCVPGSIVDCNSNGNADSCDIAGGTSQDCNGNGIPDECDISGGSSNDCNSNGVPDECEVDPCPPPTGSTLLLAFTTATTLPTIGTVQNEDIAQYNTGSGTWSLYFDGSNVGLSSFTIDGLAVLPGGDLLISTTAAGTVGGVAIDDSDILRFTPTSLGANTAGTWSMYFDGSDVGLSTNAEDLDAVSIAPDGRLVISTSGSASVPGVSSADEDLLIFTATSLGSTTAGSWAMYFDGSDVGLSTSSSENIDAASILSNGLISLSTVGNFSVTGLSGVNEDVFDFSPTSLGTTTSGSFSAFFIGANAGVPSTADVSAAEELE